MKILLALCVCLSLVVTAEAKSKLSESESFPSYADAMDILSSAKCRNLFRGYLTIPMRKAFAYTVDPRGFYSQCNASYFKGGPEEKALELCNKARDKSKYITKFSPECKLFASDNKLLASMADFKLKPQELNLSIATQRRTLATIKQLVDDGADVNQTNKFGQTPLFNAVKENRQDVVEYLLEKGTDINHVSNSGSDILLLAVTYGKAELFELLLSKGANKDRSYKGAKKKLIHYAGESGHEKIVKHLISLGEDINVPDKNGVTALHYAVDRTNLKAVAMLVRLGANVKAKTKTGKTPLDYTKRKKKQKIRNFLMSRGV